MFNIVCVFCCFLSLAISPVPPALSLCLLSSVKPIEAPAVSNVKFAET